MVEDKVQLAMPCKLVVGSTFASRGSDFGQIGGGCPVFCVEVHLEPSSRTPGKWKGNTSAMRPNCRPNWRDKGCICGRCKRPAG